MEKISVHSIIESKILKTTSVEAMILNLYANQKTIDLLKSIQHEHFTCDIADWSVESGYEDYVIRVDFRISTYVLDVFADGVYTALMCKIDPDTFEIKCEKVDL